VYKRQAKRGAAQRDLAGLVTDPFDELNGRAEHAHIEEFGGRGLIVTRRA